MNSALKPVLQGVPQTGGQGSPAKGNVAGVNHAGHPQGAQNSLNHGSNSLVGQNLTNHPLGAPPQLPHAAPSMAPVSANMAQMAQNMSHHGNLSHVTQNSGPVPSTAASPNKSATTSSPLSLVQDKVTVTPSQPLALTRTPEKKEADSVSQANGTVEPPKSGSPAALKPQNNDAIKEKPDIAKTSPSTPKPPEPKPSSAPSTPLKTEAANAVGRADTPAQSKVVTASEPPEKSPAKPSEPSKPAVAPTADVAPSQSDNKPAPESAKDSQEKALIPPKPEPAKLESAKVEAPKVEPPKIDAAKAEPAKIQTLKPETPKVEPPKVEQTKSEPSKPDIPAKVVEKKEEPKVDQSKLVSKPAEEKKDDAKVDTTDGPQKEATQSPKVEEKSAKTADTLKPVAKQVETPKAAPKPDVDTPKPTVKPIEAATKVVATKPSESPKPAVKPADTPKSEPRGARSTIKLATVTPTIRKRRHPSPKSSDGPTPAKKAAESESTPDSRMKRNRTKVQLYQSPTPELTMATKLSASAGRSTPTKPNDDKLIVFYKNEYLAVRNAEGSFYVCQALQNVYRSTRKIKIRWLSQDKTADASGETYKPDFYDVTDMECVLTTLSLVRAPSGCGAQLLKPAEEARAKSILQRAIKAEQSGEKAPVDVTEEHPDGLDLSLYKDESQLEKNKKGGRKRNSSKSSPKGKVDEDESDSSTPSPPKKSRAAPKRSPRSSPKKAAAAAPKAAAKRKPAGSTPTVAAASKTATAATEKASPKPAAKSTPAKRAPPKPAKAEPAHKVDSPKTPLGRGRRAAGKDSKPSTPLTPTPSTSTGKSGRSQRKPPQHK